MNNLEYLIRFNDDRNSDLTRWKFPTTIGNLMHQIITFHAQTIDLAFFRALTYSSKSF